MESDTDTSHLHLFFVPLWHRNDILLMMEIAKRLSTCNSIPGNFLSATFLLIKPPNAEPIPTSCDPCFEHLNTLNFHMEFIHLRPIEMPTSFHGPNDFITNYARLYLPEVKRAIQILQRGAVALILSNFLTSIMAIQDEFKIPTYLVHKSNALYLSFMLELQAINNKMEQEPCRSNRLIEVPGIAPVPVNFLPQTAILRESHACDVSLLCHASGYMKATGIILNSSVALEKDVLNAIEDDQCAREVTSPAIYPIGPIQWNKDEERQNHMCISWLNKQKRKSVLFLCFGSRGVFKKPQVEEIAKGLEHSEQPFLWFIQPPDTVSNSLPNATVNELLPDGFLSRPSCKGIVCGGWFPPRVILAHPAVGGFITQCAWEVVQESIWFGVPMIAWPLCQEQRLLALQMVRDMGVAVDLRMDVNREGFVSSDDFSGAIRQLMEDTDVGKSVRAQTELFKNELQRSMGIEGATLFQWKFLLEEIWKELIVLGN